MRNLVNKLDPSVLTAIRDMDLCTSAIGKAK